jgi:hypothetical protein
MAAPVVHDFCRFEKHRRFYNLGRRAVKIGDSMRTTATTRRCPKMGHSIGPDAVAAHGLFEVVVIRIVIERRHTVSSSHVLVAGARSKRIGTRGRRGLFGWNSSFQWLFVFLRHTRLDLAVVVDWLSPQRDRRGCRLLLGRPPCQQRQPRTLVL